MSDLDDEFSGDEIDLDIWNTNVINIAENEEDIDHNNDEDLEVRNNDRNEGQEGDDGSEKQNENDEGELGDKEDDEQR